MGEVVILNTITKLDIPPERILDAAKKADLESVVILGYTKEGKYYGASSLADGGDVLWLMEITRDKLLNWDNEGGDV